MAVGLHQPEQPMAVIKALRPDHPFCLFVLGRYADQTAGARSDLDAFLATVDCTAFPWAVCCFDGKENEVMVVATGLSR